MTLSIEEFRMIVVYLPNVYFPILYYDKEQIPNVSVRSSKKRTLVGPYISSINGGSIVAS